MNQTSILFVDIDGTLTKTKSGKPFKQSPDDIKPLPGAQKAITHFANRGYKIFGVSNQGGCDTIDKSTGNPFKSVNSAIKEMQNTLVLFPEITSICFCPSMDGSTFIMVNDDWTVKDLGSMLFKTSQHRKPGIGMLETLVIYHINIQSHTEWGSVNTQQSLFVGDREEDKQCAANAGIPFMDADMWRFKYGSFV